MLCKRGLCCHAVCVCVCVSVTFVHSVKTNKHIFKIVSPSGSHTILVLLYQTPWQFSDGNPLNGGVEWRWGKQKSRFWDNIWPQPQCVLWSVPVASAIHLAATDHGVYNTSHWWAAEFVGGKQRRSVWQEASTLRRRQRYAVVNLKPG